MSDSCRMGPAGSNQEAIIAIPVLQKGLHYANSPGAVNANLAEPSAY
ncbi:MAG: hypothetical protein K2R98_20320 [Gemmataceae bacterium]|nr:hypothetical protein [Gemmataceae bacterium]